MDHNENTGILLETAYLTAITIIIAVLGVHIPGVMVFTVFLSAIPLVIITIRTNEKITLLSILVSYIIIILLTGQVISATTTVLSCGFAGLTVGYGLKRKWQFKELLVLASAAYLLSILAMILLLNYIEGVNQIEKLIMEPSRQWFAGLELRMREMIKAFEGNPLYANNLEELKDRLNMVEDYIYVINMLIPSFFIISSAFLGYVTVTLSKIVLKRFKYDSKYLPCFSELVVSKGMTIVFIVSFVLLLFVDQMTLRAAIINVNFILSVILMVGGLAVLDFFVKKASIPGAVRVIIYLTVFGISLILGVILPFLHPANILVLIAMADSMFDFRKLRHGREDGGQ